VRTHAQKVFQKKKAGQDIFEPLKKNRELAYYLVEKLTASAKDILENAKNGKSTKKVQTSRKGR